MFKFLTFVFILLLILLAFTGPIAALRRPWAVRLWVRLKLVLVAYVVVRIVITVASLALNGHDIYGW